MGEIRRPASDVMIADASADGRCPHCGQALPPAPSSGEGEEDAEQPAADQPERDRRGTVLPARSKVGGIITPQ